MAQKRHSEEDGDGDDGLSKRRQFFESDVNDVLLIEIELRRVVREEIDRAFASRQYTYPYTGPSSINQSGGRRLQLKFTTKLPSTLFSGSKIEAENKSPIHIALFDSSSGDLVSSGSLSSLRVEIVPLKGEFGYDDQEDWSEKEFNDDIAKEREGRRPLLAGDLIVTLKGGVARIGNIIFTDNSSWTRTRKFRLGARVVSNCFEKVEIREARSGRFMVKDHRGELYKKHHPPYPNDEIWRLENISKDGKFQNRLVSNGIHNVKDFLRHYWRDKRALREMFGGIADNAWRSITKHASTCVLDENELYQYQEEENITILLNSVHMVIGATFNGNYYSVDKLNPDQKNVVERLKKHAHGSIDDLVSVSELCTGHIPRPLGSPETQPARYPCLDVSSIDVQVPHQDQSAIQLDFNPAYPLETDVSHQLVCSSTQHNYQIPTITNNFMITDTFPTYSSGEFNWSSNGSQRSFMPNISLSSENSHQLQTSTFFPNTPTWDEENNFLFASNSKVEPEIFPHSNSVHRAPKVRWCKIRAAITLLTAARRISRPPPIFQLFEY